MAVRHDPRISWPQSFIIKIQPKIVGLYANMYDTRAQIETIMFIVLKFQVNYTCFNRGELVETLTGEWNKNKIRISTVLTGSSASSTQMSLGLHFLNEAFANDDQLATMIFNFHSLIMLLSASPLTDTGFKAKQWCY